MGEPYPGIHTPSGVKHLMLNRREVLGLAACLPFAKIEIPDVPRFSTGVPEVDCLLGGGYPVGHVTLVDGFTSMMFTRKSAPSVHYLGGRPKNFPPHEFREPTHQYVENALAAAEKAGEPAHFIINQLSKLEEWACWFKGAQVPITLNAWIARTPEIRETLHRICSLELEMIKCPTKKGVDYLVRVEVDRLDPSRIGTSCVWGHWVDPEE